MAPFPYRTLRRRDATQSCLAMTNCAGETPAETVVCFLSPFPIPISQLLFSTPHFLLPISQKIFAPPPFECMIRWFFKTHCHCNYVQEIFILLLLALCLFSLARTLPAAGDAGVVGVRIIKTEGVGLSASACSPMYTSTTAALSGQSCAFRTRQPGYSECGLPGHRKSLYAHPGRAVL